LSLEVFLLVTFSFMCIHSFHGSVRKKIEKHWTDPISLICMDELECRKLLHTRSHRHFRKGHHPSYHFPTVLLQVLSLSVVSVDKHLSIYSLAVVPLEQKWRFVLSHQSTEATENAYSIRKGHQG
jgi:hypothetical protein